MDQITGFSAVTTGIKALTDVATDMYFKPKEKKDKEKERVANLDSAEKLMHKTYKSYNNENTKILKVKVDAGSPAIELYHEKEKADREVYHEKMDLEKKHSKAAVIVGAFIFTSLSFFVFKSLRQRTNHHEVHSDRIKKQFIFSKKFGQGGQSTTFLAFDKANQEFCVIKKFNAPGNEIRRYPMREMLLLTEISHPNIVRLNKVIVDDECIYLVMEHLQMGLLGHRLLYASKYPGIVKSFMRNLLAGVAVLHSKHVIHRDIKPKNLLVDTTTKPHTLKLGDFGNASTSLNPQLTQLLTLEYSAPEILLGDIRCKKSVDIWAVGCVFGQMASATNDPVFYVNAKNAEDQIVGIFRLLGTPDNITWPGVVDMPMWKEFGSIESPGMSGLFPNLNQDGLDLISRMLCLNPADRITADEALEHPYFTEDAMLEYC